ncbi:MAG: exodeoxyribonuclease VII large subunit [Actinomycetota bacterium]|nr:exodeoxyribonuclease VII large subunit [Actinomycetota bacterium]
MGAPKGGGPKVAEDPRALSVSEAMTLAKRALEGVQVRVVGEVSEFSDKPGYKAAYFSVCDGEATMPCMMWRDAYLATGVELRCGMLVEIAGFFSAYVPKGRMQFMVRSLTLAGEGQLRLQVAALARKLETEGLMRLERKRPIPRYPERIAVVTSPRGKAIHDVIRTLRRRYPLAELLVAGVQVEGDGAPQAIVEGLEAAADAHPDVILLVRGGGSYEDLMPFNAENVARAIVASPVPVVTGIGHEPDTSIADMVADLRASTPTAAAEATAPSVFELEAVLLREQRLLGQALLHLIRDAGHQVRRLAERPVLTEPRMLLYAAGQRLDLADTALRRALPVRLARDAERLGYARGKFLTAGTRVTERVQSAVEMSAARLHDLSPLAILGRGYAVCFADDGRTVVRTPQQVTCGDSVTVRVFGGRIGCTVQETVTETEASHD